MILTSLRFDTWRFALYVPDKKLLRTEREFGPFYADYFASDISWRMPPFYARYPCGESKGINAFSVSCNKGVEYFHPPVGLTWKVVRHEEKMQVRGVLMAPD